MGSGERPGERKETQAQGMKGVGRCKNHRVRTDRPRGRRHARRGGGESRRL